MPYYEGRWGGRSFAVEADNVGDARKASAAHLKLTGAHDVEPWAIALVPTNRSHVRVRDLEPAPEISREPRMTRMWMIGIAPFSWRLGVTYRNSGRVMWALGPLRASVTRIRRKAASRRASWPTS